MQAVPLQDWFMAHKIKDEMLWKDSAHYQIMFARDTLCALIGRDLKYPKCCEIVTVISTHWSKSIELPVYKYDRSDIGLQLYLRNNFFDWKLSVVSEQPIRSNFAGLFHTTSPVEPEYTGNELASCYFEGFPADLIFGYYEETDGRKWSAAITHDFLLWSTMFILLRDLGAVKPRKWHTRESHKKELAEMNAEVL
jgi:hypothetical protein